MADENRMKAPSKATPETIPTAAAAHPAGITRAWIASRRLGAKGPDGRSPIADALARIEARRDGRELPIATPWNSVNEALGGGMWPGFYVLVGGTGAGKSQWALQLGLCAARDASAEGGVPVLYLALELDTFGMVCRALAAAMHEQGGGPQWSALYRGVADPSPDAAAALDGLRFHVVEAEAHGFDYNDVADALAAFREEYPREKHPRALVVLDFLQLVSAPEKDHVDLRERISRAAYRCRIAARDHSLAVVALSSTARRVGDANPMAINRDESGDPVRAMLHDLVGMGKESGDVEYSADGVMVMCREPWEEEKAPGEPTRVHLAVAKLRMGRGSWCQFTFDGTTFRDAPVERSAQPSKGGAKGGAKGAARGNAGASKAPASNGAKGRPRMVDGADDDDGGDR